jgi:hypothetical protein
MKLKMELIELQVSSVLVITSCRSNEVDGNNGM